MNRGDTFIWDPNGADNEHLYIAITQPGLADGRFVVFNLTKSVGGKKSFTLRIGEHQFINLYDSDVNFGDGLITKRSQVQHEISKGRATPHAPLKLGLVESIALIAVSHPAVSNEIVRMIKADQEARRAGSIP